MEFCMARCVCQARTNPHCCTSAKFAQESEKLMETIHWRDRMHPLCLIDSFDESQTVSNLFSNLKHPKMSWTERMFETIVISRYYRGLRFDIDSTSKATSLQPLADVCLITRADACSWKGFVSFQCLSWKRV